MDETAITIWDYDDAPKHLQAMSPHGGDEDWVVVFPAGITEQNMPWSLERMILGLQVCDTSYHKAPDGRLVAITCHA